MAIVTPESIGPYPLLGILGQGGMGTVYLALHRGAGGFEKKVALKCIAPHVADDEAFIRMLVDEARLMSRLTHPNIVQVIDLAVYEGLHVLVLEYVEGVDLRTLASGADITLAEAAHIIADAARGLAYAHRKCGADGRPLGIVHRDISGHNVLVSTEGAVKVLDFGVAKAASNRQRTEVGVLKGKLPYMSPEQAAGKPLDGRSDLFSLGIVLWELCTRQRLFTGDTEMQVLLKVQRCEVERPSKLVPGFPRELDDIVVRVLQPDPEQRHADGDELADALMQFERSHRGKQDSRQRLAARVQAEVDKKNIGVARSAGERTGSATRIGNQTMGDGTVAAAPPRETVRAKHVRLQIAALVTAMVVLAGAAVFFMGGGITVERPVAAPEPAETPPLRPLPVLTHEGGEHKITIQPANAAPTATAVPAVNSVPVPARVAAVTKPQPVGRHRSPEPETPAPQPEPEHRTPGLPPPPRPLPVQDVGFLSVNASPWARVYIDGKIVSASTPLLKHALAPGKHRLVLVNPEARLRKELDVELAAGKHERLTITWP